MIPGSLDRIDIFKRREQYDLRIAALHEAGCKCEKPWPGWRQSIGPRCKTCGTIAEVLK